MKVQATSFGQLMYTILIKRDTAIFFNRCECVIRRISGIKNVFIKILNRIYFLSPKAPPSGKARLHFKGWMESRRWRPRLFESRFSIAQSKRPNVLVNNAWPDGCLYKCCHIAYLFYQYSFRNFFSFNPDFNYWWIYFKIRGHLI